MQLFVLSLDVVDTVSYFVIRLPSRRHLALVQSSGLCGIPTQRVKDFNVAFATSSFVIIILSIMDGRSQTFEAYALMLSAVGDPTLASFDPVGYAFGVNPKPVRVDVIRRGLLSPHDVSYIRDNTGLNGRSVSFALDGQLLGIAAGRTLCRLIDKRAFNNDPTHYKDEKYQARTCSESQPVSVIRSTPDQAQFFLSLNYQEYCYWFANASDGHLRPAIENIVGLQ